MAKTLKQVEKIVDYYEIALRKLDHVITYDKNGKKVDLELTKVSVIEFLKDFLYHNHLSSYEMNGDTFHYTTQIKNPGEVLAYKCYVNARRSIGDLFRLALEYYSDKVTLYDIMEGMYTIVQDATKLKCKTNNTSGVVYMNICHNIHRRVFNLDAGGSNRINFRFDNRNNDYTKETHLDQEFNILGTDYDLLFNTISGKSFLKGRRESGFTLQVSKAEELDRMVMEKLARMTEVRQRVLEF